MTTIRNNRPPAVQEAIVKKVQEVSESAVAQKVGEVATKIDGLNDQFELATAAVTKLAQTRTGARIIGGVVGGVTEHLRPGTLSGDSAWLAKVATKVGLPNVSPALARMGGAIVAGAGVASIAYDAVKTFTNTNADLGSRAAQSAASVAVAGATFIPGVGTAILAAEVVTGGGVSGGVKGLVALGDAALTGDRDALNQWAKDAKSGEHGWLVEKLANNATVSRAVGAGAEAVIKKTAAAQDRVARGWQALTSW